jgi:hypothetical protein
VTTKDEALARIEAAFSGVPRPNNGELVHPESFDDMDLEPLYEIDSWRDMNDEALINSYAAPSFLSAAGFLYFLPAYMRFSLNNPDSPEAVVSAPIWSLDPSLYSERIAAYARSKYALFDEAQRAAIIAFLEAMTDSSYGENAVHALREWS